MTWRIDLRFTFTGTGPGGVQYTDGIGYTTDPDAAQSCRDSGFDVVEVQTADVPPRPALIDVAAYEVAVVKVRAATTVAGLRDAVLDLAAAITPSP